MRVLLIEDEADIADALALFLRAQGHAVDRAPDLETARAALDVAAFDAILLDLALPDGSGLTLLGEERRKGNRAPVIIATARDQITERIAGLDAGADDYVVKPYDLAEIEARLRAMAAAPRAIRQRKAMWGRCGWTGQGHGCFGTMPKFA